MNFSVGSLVRARGREWVVLPESSQAADMLVLRPLGGNEDEITGIFVGKGTDGRPFEEVVPAEFPLPDPRRDLGNHQSASLLRDAVRLGFRAGAGPFRSLARIAVEPRPYQLVPLLMALKQDPVRLLIADDVGIGKTIEACLIARELIDRGEIQRFAVLCPPHLGEQWQRALREQFHLDAALVLSGTAARLEREDLRSSIFQRYPYTVVSTDYIKQERRRFEFRHSCPELVIVDEAHGCAASGGRGASQLRHELLRELAQDLSRHLILVTATPHSGNQETFRSLLSLLDPNLRELPEDLGGDENRRHREQLARHFVQRRRGDLQAYMDTETPFPDRETAEAHYSLKPQYRDLLERVLKYCRETVVESTASPAASGAASGQQTLPIAARADDAGALQQRRHQRVRWWSALALLRSLASSPAAAAATLRNRSVTASGETEEAIDEEGRRAVLDLDDQSAEGLDVVPGSIPESDGTESAERRRLLALANEVEALRGGEDAKLRRAEELVQGLLKEGCAPILFCRFIPTVEYVAEALRAKLKGVTVEAITGELPPEERERRVEELGHHDRRVLVCTDCLSEGINLQHRFDAVIHYDLSWNPTRHEQREGRVDRYGQQREKVRALTLYGADNPIDGIVLEVLLRKHQAIRKQLGIAVPIPLDTKVVERAIYEGLILRERRDPKQLSLTGIIPEQRAMDLQWDTAVEREKKSRSLFAQHQLQKAVTEEIGRELSEVRRAIGGEADVERFALSALRGLRATVSANPPREVDVREAPSALRDAIDRDDSFTVVFRGRPPADAELLTRTHPIVAGLATHVLECALDGGGPGKRCGVIRTRAVGTRTTLFLLRMRFHIVTKDREGITRPLLAEDVALLGYRGSPENADWLTREESEALLAVTPDANIGPDVATQHLLRVTETFESLLPRIQATASERAAALLDAHRRVRKAARTSIQTQKVEDHGRPDVLGLYVYLPADAA